MEKIQDLTPELLEAAYRRIMAEVAAPPCGAAENPHWTSSAASKRKGWAFCAQCFGTFWVEGVL